MSSDNDLSSSILSIFSVKNQSKVSNVLKYEQSYRVRFSRSIQSHINRTVGIPNEITKSIRRLKQFQTNKTQQIIIRHDL